MSHKKIKYTSLLSIGGWIVGEYRAQISIKVLFYVFFVLWTAVCTISILFFYLKLHKLLFIMTFFFVSSVKTTLRYFVVVFYIILFFVKIAPCVYSESLCAKLMYIFLWEFIVVYVLVYVFRKMYQITWK